MFRLYDFRLLTRGKRFALKPFVYFGDREQYCPDEATVLINQRS